MINIKEPFTNPIKLNRFHMHGGIAYVNIPNSVVGGNVLKMKP